MKKRIVIGILCLIGFLLIMILVLTNNMTSFDDSVYEWIYGHHNQYLDFFFKYFTHIGDTIPVICIAAILILLFKSWEDKTKIGFTLAFTVAVNQLLKYSIARERPPLERRLITQKGYSFPSGHAMVSMCIYGILIYFVMTKIKKKEWKIIFTSLLTIMILLIGISRIYVGVHYPSDVLGGYLLAIPILIASISFLDYHFKGE